MYKNPIEGKMKVLKLQVSKSSFTFQMFFEVDAALKAAGQTHSQLKLQIHY